MYKRHEDCFWRAEEVNLETDIRDWNTRLSEDDKYFIEMVLAFFAASDGIVNENLALRFMADTNIPEARCFYGFQIMTENIHSEVYSNLIDTFIQDPVKKDKLFNAVEHFPCIRKKALWAQKWISESRSYAHRLVAFACVEGIFFSSSFSAIYWIKKRGLMPGLTFSNELISRDESIHTSFACLMYSLMPSERLDDATFYELIREATDVEIEFITEALPCRLIGMNATSMTQYIKFVADRLSVQLGYDKIYNTSNPFDFMILQSIDVKSNFFEKTVSSYALANKSDDKLFGQEGEIVEF
jgi:ribonucleoside-diphosphate reductase subunit M2